MLKTTSELQSSSFPQICPGPCPRGSHAPLLRSTVSKRRSSEVTANAICGSGYGHDSTPDCCSACCSLLYSSSRLRHIPHSLRSATLVILSSHHWHDFHSHIKMFPLDREAYCAKGHPHSTTAEAQQHAEPPSQFEKPACFRRRREQVKSLLVRSKPDAYCACC